MNRPVRVAVCLLPVLVVCGVAREAPSPEPPDDSLTCTIRADPTCEPGKAPAVSVEIVNHRKRDVYLVGSLDASDCRWRYPHCYFEVIGPAGKAAGGIGRCGNMNRLREKDFVKVAPGGKFSPYQKVDDHGFFPAHQLSAGTFAAEGKYRIRFFYSTDKADIKYWLGDGATSENLERLFKQVPKLTLRSNEITVTVVRRR